MRMNFTVMRDNLRSLPGIAALAQELDVPLYLNLATDRTFLFRADEVAGQADVALEELSAVMADLEDIARSDRRNLPRYSDLAYVRRHFTELVQRDLPCAESQLKLMIHSRGEIGGCWGHDPTFNVRQLRISERDRLRPLPRRARALLPQGLRRLRLELQPQPAVAAVELHGRCAVAGRGPSPRSLVMRSSIELFDALADGYEDHFAVAHRKAYDDLAWETVSALLPPVPGPIVDAGCGTGRWARRLVALGYRVIGIEQAPAMIAELRRRPVGPGFRLVEGPMGHAELAPNDAAMVLAMGSLQYNDDPDAVLARLAGWARPSGVVCVLVDSLVALALELVRAGRPDEAVQRLRQPPRGVAGTGSLGRPAPVRP